MAKHGNKKNRFTLYTTRMKLRTKLKTYHFMLCVIHVQVWSTHALAHTFRRLNIFERSWSFFGQFPYRQPPHLLEEGWFCDAADDVAVQWFRLEELSLWKCCIDVWQVVVHLSPILFSLSPSRITVCIYVLNSELSEWAFICIQFRGNLDRNRNRSICMGTCTGKRSKKKKNDEICVATVLIVRSDVGCFLRWGLHSEVAHFCKGKYQLVKILSYTFKICSFVPSVATVEIWAKSIKS